MAWWIQVRAILGYMVLMAAVWAAMHFTPAFTMVKREYGYRDMANIGDDERIRVDATIPFENLRRGDLIALHVPAKGGIEAGDAAFARIAGLPGDRVGIRNGLLLINDLEPGDGMNAPRSSPDRPEIRVPRDHLFVVSSEHRFDSFAFGPVPRVAVIGHSRRNP